MTYAREWRLAHGAPLVPGSEGNEAAVVESLAAFVPPPNVALTLSQLAQFLRNPVKSFFRQRLQVAFDETEQDDSDDESFAVDGLQQYKLLQELVATATAEPSELQEQMCVTRSLAKLRKSGVLPIKVFGELEQQGLQDTLSTMLIAWRTQQARFPHPFERQSIRLEEGAVVLEDWIDNLRRSDVGTEPGDDEFSDGKVAWLEIQTSNLLQRVDRANSARPEKLLGAWVRSLAVAASGIQAWGILVGRDGVVEIPPIPQEIAVETLKGLMQLWLDGMSSPLPLPPKTALAFVQQKNAQTKYEGDYMMKGEVEETCLARMFPDFDALMDDGQFASLAQSVYGPIRDWAVKQVKVTVHANVEVMAEESL
jgi:exodeoxyribonuclease V gamma subunit